MKPLDPDPDPHERWLGTLDPGIWARANRELLAKLLTELVFEEVLSPEETGEGPGAFSLQVGTSGVLTYRATKRHLGHWRVHPDSLRWHPARSATSNGEAELPDVVDLVAMAAPTLGLDSSTAAGILCELANTLLSDAWQLAHGRPANDLADADPALVEGEMRGHPWIVANKGRVGFDADDLARFSPEAQQPVQLMWLAAAPGRADARSVTGLDHASVVQEQVGEQVWTTMRERAAAGGLDPDDAVYLPVHPWQWRSRILPLHATDLARGTLVPLGEQPARYLPQQSIRTLVDMDHPERRYLKLPLSILNTSVYRGLVRNRTLAAPALSEWLAAMTNQDPFLAETGLILLGEVASVSVAHPAFEALPDVPYQHTEMLGAVWRESIAGRLDPGERAVTLAALLHRDPSGTPFLDPVIQRSGLTVAEWVDRLHTTILPPLVHMLYRFGMMFSPHAQNCLLVLDGYQPTRLAFKDFADDAVISTQPLPEQANLPTEVRRCLGEGIETPLLVQWIQGGLLVCVYRYLSEILEDNFGYPEKDFWASATATLGTYQDRFGDELAERFALFDLVSPAFVKLCLNRLRMFERGYTDDAERPLIGATGWMENPLARV